MPPWKVEETMGADGDALSDADEEADDCICGVEHLAEEATSDTDLPPASGGIEPEAEPQDSEDDVDGCELDFTIADQTSDEELPAAAGGV
jgi:hypothetical protein